MIHVSINVNGIEKAATLDDRVSLADFVREQCHLTGTHLGCEHGACGACTVNLDGEPVRACIMLAAAADSRNVCTIEGFDNDPTMAVLRETFREAHGLQCGYCTPGMLITSRDIVLRGIPADAGAIRRALGGNVCRCTGYMGIVNAILLAMNRLRSDALRANSSTG